MEVLRAASNQIGVFYPVQTFTEDRKPSWKDIPVCIEASTAENEETLMTLASTISEHVSLLNSNERQGLHLSAVLINNFTNYLFRQAFEIAREKNIDPMLLEALARETVSKAFEMGPEEAQTGPAARGDKRVIEKHLELLKGLPNAQKLYKLFSSLIGGEADGLA
jgi:predicted short-subunit dehydrogenase-like oxidoreductase (DUF2520 family)